MSTYYSRKDLALRFGVRPCTIKEWELAGKLGTPIRLSQNVVRYTAEAVEAFVAKSAK